MSHLNLFHRGQLEHLWVVKHWALRAARTTYSSHADSDEVEEFSDLGKLVLTDCDSAAEAKEELAAWDVDLDEPDESLTSLIEEALWDGTPVEAGGVPPPARYEPFHFDRVAIRRLPARRSATTALHEAVKYRNLVAGEINETNEPYMTEEGEGRKKLPLTPRNRPPP